MQNPTPIIAGLDTSYHVYVPTRGWLGPQLTPEPTWTQDVNDACIFSRLGAIRAAMVHGGSAWMHTRTGKLQRVNA